MIDNKQHPLFGLGSRLITGMSLAIVFLLLIYFAPWWMLATVATSLIILAMSEYNRLVFSRVSTKESLLIMCYAIFLPWTVMIGGTTLAGALAIVPLVVAWTSLATDGNFDQLIDRALKHTWGLIYIGGAFCSLLIMAAQEQGRLLVLFEVSTVVAADTGAYFVGRFWGRHYLAPSISPGKTYEGLAGGLFLAGLAGGVIAGICLPDTRAGIGILLGFLLAIVSVIGDLLESSLKRAAGAKDSGSILPGHGGLLDRIDGILAASPVFLLCRELWW